MSQPAFDLSGGGGFNPPLVEDDPHTGDLKIFVWGVGFDTPVPIQQGWPSFCNGQTYREAAKASLPPNPPETVFVIVISIVTEIAVVLPFGLLRHLC